MRKNDITALGELLIDMTQSGTDSLGNGTFTAYPGGAPANVAVAVARLGAKAGFIGKVGNDAFGKSLSETLTTEGVDITGLFYSDEVPTTMALVSVSESGERSFAFYRDPGADTQLTEQEALSILGDGELPKILHVGSLSLTAEPSRTACMSAVRFVKENKGLVSYDPNYRVALWKSEEEAIQMMKKILPLADILKVSDEEMEMLTDTADCEEASRILSEYGPALVMITLGSEGVFLRCGEQSAVVPGFKVTVADTNGAGDSFMGAMLEQIADKNCHPEQIEWEELKSMAVYANKVAALTCSRSGAIPAMPYKKELDEFSGGNDGE